MKAKIIDAQSTLFQIDQQRDQLNQQLEHLQVQYQYAVAVERPPKKRLTLSSPARKITRIGKPRPDGNIGAFLCLEPL